MAPAPFVNGNVDFTRMSPLEWSDFPHSPAIASGLRKSRLPDQRHRRAQGLRAGGGEEGDDGVPSGGPFEGGPVTATVEWLGSASGALRRFTWRVVT